MAMADPRFPAKTREITEKLQQIEFRAMGSQILAARVPGVSQGVEADDEQASGRRRLRSPFISLLAEVPFWFEEWEQVLSRFRPDSELSQLNAVGSISTAVPVSETLWTVLQLALQVADYTDGLVTPTILDSLEAAGYDTSFDVMTRGIYTRPPADEVPVLSWPASNAELDTPQSTSWRKIKTYPDTRFVLLPSGVRLDFGGVAKGWAADEAVKRLAKYGPALVNAGGDVAVSGPMLEGTGWPIGVDAPAGMSEMNWRSQEGAQTPGGLIELLSMKSGGVATSGRDYRRWQQGGTWRHHIIDPRTGSPADTDVVSATVVAPSTSMAEIGAKVALLLGSRDGLDWLEARPSMAGLLVLEDGQIIRSRYWANYVWSS
jgi:thiamine biosynthesis lipoprotein